MDQKCGDYVMDTQSCGLNSHPPTQERPSENITDNIPLYNSRIIKNYVEYLRVYCPDIDISSILKHADIESYQLDDEGHWLTQTQVDRFHEMLTKKVDNPRIAREVGRYSVTSRASGAMRQYILGFINPETAYAVIGKISSSVTRATTVKTKLIGADKIEAKVTLMPNVVEKPYSCLYRLGALEAVAKLSTGKFADIEHPVCLHKGGDCCLYIISWKKTPTFVWKLIRNYSFIVGFIACVLSASVMPSVYWDALVLSCILMMMGTTLYAEHREKGELLVKIHNQGDAADRLIDQINVSYNNTRLVQEIGQATSMILDINKLLAFIMEALEKRLDFDRGMIMLANRERTRLVYTIGYGYNPEHRNYLENIEFHLDNPDSRGAFVVSFRNQTPFLINDASEITKDFSPRSIEFVKRMGTRSFICVPITYEGRSEGVLAVDNLRSDRTLNETDISLLMGIASQIGISINNARTYEKLQEREKRFRILAESAPDIIFTLDTGGMLTYVNPMWEKILGHKQDEVVGKYLTKFLQEQDSNYLIQLFRKIRDHKETQMDILLTLMSRSGAEHNFSFNCAPNIAEDGHVDSLVGIFKDVTDLRRSEVELKKSYERLQLALSSTISVISLISESRDPYTAGHQRKVAELASAIARELGLPEDRVKMIHMAGLIHDIGKINVPAEILSRPGKLTTGEFALIKSHPETGYNILNKVDFPGPIAQIVYQHHEKMDGSGYPLMISGDQIVLEARIITVADVVEAMAGHRPYRPALGIEKALDEIRIGRGVVYDAAVADACISLFSTNRFHFEEAVTD